MPITSLRLSNFKCFADSENIPIRPLTVVFGRNNVGKSTILQGLLTLKQTLDSGEYESRLSIRGPLFNGGEYSDVVHAHRVRHNLGIQLGIQDPRTKHDSILTLEYSSDEPRSPKLANFQLKSSSQPDITIKRGVGAGGPYELYIGHEKIGNEKVANFSFPVNGLFPTIGDELPRPGRPNTKRNAARARARSILEYTQRTLRELRALGAFRQSPQRKYDYAGSINERTDIEGRYVIDALIDDVTRRGAARGRLFKEVNRWLFEVGRVTLQPLVTIANSKRTYEVRLRATASGRWVNFADVGSGIGQAFPVLVEGLRTPVGGTYLVQEPEIHLHPDAQLAMADFLYELANSGRRVIVETHSEAMLLRFRRKFVESQRAREHLAESDFSLIVVEQKNGHSSVREVTIDSLGQISGWPTGFMEDVSKERMALMLSMAEQVSKDD